MRARVRVHVFASDVREIDMGVELRCCNTRMAQQLLHDTKIHTPFEQVSGKTMPQRVWMKARDTHDTPIVLNQGKDRLTGDRRVS